METVRTITDGINRKKAMKKIYRYFFAAVAIASAAACAEQMEDNQLVQGQPSAGLSTMTFSASIEENIVSKTTYNNQSVLWEATDAITVFSMGESVTSSDFTVTTLAEDKTWASFSGVADASAETYYAVYPHSATNACTAEGVLTVEIPAQQTAVAGGFASGANVSVAYSKKGAEVENMLQFKNVSALIAFKFETAANATDTKSVTFKVRKSDDGASVQEFYNIAGNVSVTFGEDGLPVVSEGTVDHVTLNAPDGGFKTGVTYYVPVCPIASGKGLQVIFTDQNDREWVKNNSNDVALVRSKLFDNAAVPFPYCDMTFTVDFTGDWPFKEPIAEIADQKTETGEYYTFPCTYVLDGAAVQSDLKFGIARGTTSDDKKTTGGYRFVQGTSTAPGYFMWHGKENVNSLSLIMLPNIEGMCLKEVRVLSGSASTVMGGLNLTKGFPTGSGSTLTRFPGGTEFTITFPHSASFPLSEDNIICLRGRFNFKLAKIYLGYVKTPQE